MKQLTVAIDFSDNTERVLAGAISLAKGLDAKISLIHIIAPEPEFVGFDAYTYPGPDVREDQLQKEKNQLREMVDQLKEAGVECAAFMKESPVVAGLMEFADHHDADIIVVGSHGHGAIARLLLGSIAEGVVRQSKIPVLVVPSRE